MLLLADFLILKNLKIFRMFVEGMLCNEKSAVVDFYPDYHNLTPSENLMDKIKDYYQTKWFVNQKASWDDRFKPAFTEVLTKFGYGFAFNMMPKLELFTSK